jgi:ubiquinone/menaquinone biosynthesis C-methylase UbiE
MEAYTSFARVYDVFMDNIPYEEWAAYVERLLNKQGIKKGLLLDLGCGTGNFTQMMAKKGYDMIGVDNSEEMLEIAQEKKMNGKEDILYLLQDMREFELYGTVGAVVSVCDSMNYITEEEDLLAVFKLVNNYLDPGGVFIFDLNTVYKYETILADSVIAENRERSSFIWENYYYKEEKINEYDLTIFVEEKNGLYRKYEETHYQKAYEVKQIRELIEKAGMKFIAAYEAFTEEEVKEDSERIYIIAEEKGKIQKRRD